MRSSDAEALAALQAFGDRVRAYREQAQLSQEGLAARSGLHRTYVGSVERGERNVSLLNIVHLAEALGVNPGTLLSGLSLTRASQPAADRSKGHRPE
ncbi:helix-turn-helix domain-containing protein [Angustibacter sp. Root456]|uniref:helix-turn-helix domain-containing protein n=1 Tax=Angustibacter sp. Root456 TaxID=1736539 RepID=UPI0009E956B0|nr:helix-turn-helix transcriptional regulator [Angustibacter sp. Root456]